MAATCGILSKRYATEFKAPIPAVDAGTDAFSEWLLKDEDICVNQDGKKQDRPLPCTTSQIHVFEQSGFIAWLNERGYKCVNKILGKIYDPTKPPGADHPFPKSSCNTECRVFNSDTCFSCVEKVLKEDPSICDTDLNTLKQCVECTDKIADTVQHMANKDKGEGPTKNGVYILGQTENAPPSHITAVMNTARGIEVNSTAGPDLIAIVVGSVLGGLLVLFIGYQAYRRQFEPRAPLKNSSFGVM